MPSADGVTPEGHNDTTVLIVGGGFSGIATLYRCRKLGLSAKILEKGENFGGVWHWNRYPGARVDSEWPMYQLNIPEAYDTWTFRERFPDHYELREYIAHLDKTLGLSKDTIFGAEVVDAAFDTTRTRWSVLTASGLRLSAKYLVLATGLLHKAYVPKFPGFADYRGHVVHSTSWPEDLDCKGKKIGVVGSGATAVQVVQELAKATADGGSLTVMMKRPSTCVPLQQQQLSVQEQNKWKGWFETLFDAGRKSFTGFPLANTGQNACDVSKEELDARLQMLWQRGAFNFLLGGYRDTSYNPKSNRAVYDFWASKVRSRISDPAKRDIMAPLEPLYPIGGKRPPLEIDYYECLDMGHVEIVSLLSNPIEKFVEDGVVLQDGTHRQLDIVALATGFDSYTGSLCQMGLKDKHGKELKDIWADGVSTYLGICMNGFPNAFIIYSPQAPTAFSNGPTILECQADLVVDTIARLEREKAKSIEATASAAEEWGRETEKTLQGSLTANTDSWWNGGNIPGKKKQVLVYNAGIASYESICQKKLGTWEGFEICK